MKLPRAHHLPVNELVGQVLMPAIHLSYMNKNSKAAQKIIQMVKRCQITGLCLLGGHPADVRYWTDYLQKESKYPLLFAANFERGLGNVFTPGTLFPHNLCFGAAGSKKLVADFAEVVAKEVRSVGMNVVFGPMLDLAEDPQNPIVNIRCWHSDPKVVSEYGQLFIETIQKYGIACVAKHFPGHGSTEIDSHVELPVLKKKFVQIENEDLVAFRKACEARVQGVMAGHVKLEGFKYPATMESGLIQNLLRDEWRYDGVVFTDALDMGAITNHFKPREQVFYPIEAGADILLMPEKLRLSFELLQKEIKSNESFRRKIERAADRIFRLKKWLHRQQSAQAHPYRIYNMIEHPNHINLANKVAKSGITLLHRSKRFPLNLSKIQATYHIIFTDTDFADQPLKHFCRELKQFFKSVEILNNPKIKDIRALQVQRNSIMVTSLQFRTIPKNQQKLNWKLVNQAIKSLGKFGCPLIIYLFGNPYQINNLIPDHQADALLLTFSDVEVAQQAAFRALLGSIKIRGKLPVMLDNPFNKSLRLAKTRIQK
jgi:beta-N-acetylhexosaminidase